MEIVGTWTEIQCWDGTNTEALTEKYNAILGRDKYRRGADRDKAVCCCSVFGSDVAAATWGMVTQTFHSLMLVLSKRMSSVLLYLVQENYILSFGIYENETCGICEVS